jgi:cytochrome c5
MHIPDIRSGRMGRHGFAIILSAIALCAATRLPLHAQEAATPTLPEGPGQSLVSAQCTNCHALDVALSKRGTPAEWSAIVKTMIERGAPITTADAAIIAAYLGQHYGAGAPAPAPAASASARASAGQAGQASALPDLPGRDVLTKKCTQCHAMSMWTALRQDRKAWDGVMYRMVGRGALWTEDDIRAMAGYLARVRGPQ